MRRFLTLAAAAALLTAVGCSQPDKGVQTTSLPPPSLPSAGAEVPKSPPPPGNPDEEEKLQCVIETEHGNVFIKFYPREAPLTVANFIALARSGFYNGLTFHRVVREFVVQGGGGGPGYAITGEFNCHKHVMGAVAMARGQDPNSAGSQFYICLRPQPYLDGQYSIFGQVTAGMDVVQRIKRGDHMLKVRIEPRSAAR